MQLQIHGHGVEVTDALREYVESKMVRINRHAEGILDGRVQLSLDKTIQKAEAQIRIAGKDVHAEAVGQDLYAAIDVLADKLDRQLVKHKEKQVDSNRRAEGINRVGEI